MTIETGFVEVTDEAELRDLVGRPTPWAEGKVRYALHAFDREWLAHSPLCLVATSAPDGTCDVSPKGDPPGFVKVLDDHTVVVPERPGNKRVDGFRNILGNPHVGLISLLPGRGDTLRINGRARILRDAPFFDDMTVRGSRPKLALLVQIEQIFFHCSKSFLRSRAWDPDTWRPDALPPRARLSKELERRNDPIEVLEEHYGPRYAEHLYD